MTDEELITEMLEALKQAVIYIQAFRDSQADIALTKARNAIAKAERRPHRVS